MAASKPFRLNALQGALIGSFFLHLLALYILSRPGGNPPIHEATQTTALQVQLVSEPPLAMQEPSPENDTPVSTPPEAPVQVHTPSPPPEPPKKEKTTEQTQQGTQVLSWTPSNPKVVSFEDVAYPPHTSAISATMEIEVSLDKEGKATDVRMLREAPPSIFTEWAWEMGMKGHYTPKITAEGPVPSKIVVRFDILPGQPVSVQ